MQKEPCEIFAKMPSMRRCDCINKRWRKKPLWLVSSSILCFVTCAAHAHNMQIIVEMCLLHIGGTPRSTRSNLLGHCVALHVQIHYKATTQWYSLGVFHLGPGQVIIWTDSGSASKPDQQRWHVAEGISWLNADCRVCGSDPVQEVDNHFRWDLVNLSNLGCRT